ncbi:hypothetical protein ACWD4V_01235 [Streptomyces tsukubensis]
MSRTVILEALATAGVAAYVDDDGLLIAHPADVPRDKALCGEFIILATLDGSQDWYRAEAWVLYGGDFFEPIATVFDMLIPAPVQCARAVAEWVTTPRPSAGAVLLAALAEWGITLPGEDAGSSYAVPLDPATPAKDVHNRPHLSVGDRDDSVEHVPAAHTGWSVFLHDEDGSPVGDPLFISGDGGPVDCHADSTAVAEFIADFLSRPTR